MNYNYNEQKPYVLSDDGSADVIRIKNFIDEAIADYGAVRMQEIMDRCKFATCDTWEMMACVDRLVELKQISEVTRNISVAGQHRIFTKD
jgi:hypothetical protein